MQRDPQLNCVQCQKLKKKCDKRQPCSSCLERNFVCEPVHRRRLPRGKSGNAKTRNDQLLARVARLEGMILEARVEKSTLTEEHGTTRDRQSRFNSDPSTKAEIQITDAFVAKDFWDSLVSEVTGLRDVLDDAIEEDQEPADVEPPQINQSYIIFNSTPAADFGNLSYQQIRPLQREVLDIFHERYHILHTYLNWPFVEDMFMQWENPASKPASASVRALYHAIVFISSCTMSEDECRHHLGTSKASAIEQSQFALEQGLQDSQLLERPNLTTLQVFVIYISGLRSCKRNALSWSLIAVAIRLAETLGLDKVSESRDKSSELERKQLWLHIGVLDGVGAIDRGTKPMMSTNATRTTLQHLQLTDNGTNASITDLANHTMLRHRRVCAAALNSRSPSETWNKQLGEVRQLERLVMMRTNTINSNTATPYEKLVKACAADMVLTLQLLLRRPLNPQPRCHVPRDDDFNVLSKAVQLLEQDQNYQDPELSPWKWKFCPKWYALALVLVELFKRPRDQQTEKAFAVAKHCYTYFGNFVADTKDGMLWEPIRRLMRRVEAERKVEAETITNFDFSNLCTLGSTPEINSISTDHSSNFYHQPNDSFVMQSLGSDESTSTKQLNTTNHTYVPTQRHDLDFTSYSWQDWFSFVDDVNIDYSIA